VLANWAPLFSEIKLIPSKGGVFEVILDGEQIFSKKELRRHANAGEVAGLIESRLGPPVLEPEE
jgi:selenoprotein W-related protein